MDIKPKKTLIPWKFPKPRLRKRVVVLKTLPDELMIQIFLVLRELSIESPSKVVDWISVTHVCQRWRNLAINCPGLWTVPDFSRHSRERMEMFLERSKSLPLEINDCTQCDETDDSGFPCKACNKNMKLVIKELPRARILKLVDFWLDDLVAGFGLPTPVLEELDLDFLLGRPIELPEEFLAGPAPALRRVILKNCPFCPQTQLILFRNLTHLTITDKYDCFNQYNYCARFYPTVDELLEILKSCPDLETLELGIVNGLTRKKTDSDTTRTKEKVLLSRLERLTITTLNVQDADDLSSQLEYPSLLDVIIGIRFFKDTPASMILSVVQKFGRGTYYDDVGISVKTSYMISFDSLGFGGDDDAYSMHLVLLQVDDEGNVVMDKNPDRTHIMSAVAEILKNGPWEALQCLKLTISSYSPKEISLWSVFAEAVPWLATLWLELDCKDKKRASMHGVLNNILSALSLPQKDKDVPLMDLNELTITYADVQDIRDSLAKFLQQRMKAGERLSKLNFNRCSGKKECARWQRTASKNVAKIEWWRSLEEHLQTMSDTDSDDSNSGSYDESESD